LSGALSELPRVLYIDDDAGLRRLVQRALERRGFHIEQADGVSQGLARIGAEHFAVDHYMPDGDGFSLLAALADKPDAPPVVYVTGSDETRIAVTALKAGAADYVVKTVGEEFFDLLASSFTQSLQLIALRRANAAAEQELREANARLEALLGEVHHRVANSLQMVATFVSMQAAQTKDPAARTALDETIVRIQAVNQVHRRLYTSPHGDRIELDGYLTDLLGELGASIASSNDQVVLEVDAEPVLVSADHAVSIGVLVSELVTNAAKYAFLPGAGGYIEVRLIAQDGGFALTVADNGCGFDGKAPARGTGLGMRVVKAMARSLRSELRKLDTPSGSAFEMVVATA
jgi:two-component sensor histidine kinase